MGRPEWRPEWGITDSAVEAQAQAMSGLRPQPGRLFRIRMMVAVPRPPIFSMRAMPGYGGIIHHVIAAAAGALRHGHRA